MNADERLAFCRKCTNRKFDQQQGIICRLTEKKADFEDTCPDFNLDPLVKDKSESDYEPQTVRPSHELIAEISEDSKDKFREYQDFPSAILGGLLLTLVGAAIWAAVTVITGYQIVYMAIGIGLLIGFGIRYFGAGVDQKFGLLGGVLALLSCLLGNVFAQVGFAAQFENITFLEAFGLMDWSLLPEIISETFSLMDLLFYGFAIYEGYRFAFRAITEEELVQMKNANFDPIPLGYRYRRIAAGIASVILVGGVFILNQPVNGDIGLTYEDGSQMSQGTYKDGKEDGNWQYFYPGGGENIQIAADYKEGVPHGQWQFYLETGALIKVMNLQHGVMDGLSKNYYENGLLSDSGNYINDREEGQWAAYYDDGQLVQNGPMVLGKKNGSWKTYYPNGQVQSEGEMKEGLNEGLWKTWKENGNPDSEIRYEAGEPGFINYWNLKDEQVIKSGNGYFKEYNAEGVLLIEGKITNQKRTGPWTVYYEDGSKQEEGDHINDTYKLINSWKPDETQGVMNGNGKYESYNADGSMLTEDGTIQDGLREGTWHNYSPLTGSPITRSNYKAGELEGLQSTYDEDGMLSTEGIMTKSKETGEWKWYSSGDILSTATFVNGKKNGLQTTWNFVGQKAMQETYENGKRTGVILLLKED